jgi:hypothetical protein
MKSKVGGYHFLDTLEVYRRDLCCNFFHPYYFSSTQNTKAEDHHSAKTIHNITTYAP